MKNPSVKLQHCSPTFKCDPKKTQKTPKKEIEMALKIKAEYENEK